jgi:hypothetical protein
MGTPLHLKWVFCVLALGASPASAIAADSTTADSDRPRQIAAAPTDGREDSALKRATPSPEVTASIPDPTAGIAPAAPAPEFGSDRWLVAFIQKTLGEKGCYQGPVNGQWDDATEGAATQFAKLAKLPAPPREPSYDLLQKVRFAPGTLCKNPSGVGAGEVTKAKLRTEPQQHRSKAVAARKGSSAGRRAERGSQRQSAGPAVFARPVGVGRF